VRRHARLHRGRRLPRRGRAGAGAQLHRLAISLIISATAKQTEAPPDLDDVDAVFTALAHAARRQLILTLSYFGPELPSGYLARRFAHSWPTTTRHLNILQHAGIVEVRREGRTSHYRLNRPLLERVVGGWLDNLTPPSPEQTWASSGPKFSQALGERSPSKGTTPL
jgi:DNA-binding transcriptional ArsR family regulator